MCAWNSSPNLNPKPRPLIVRTRSYTRSDPWELRHASAFNLRPLPRSTERVVSPAQDTPNDSKLAPQPDEGYDSKCNATTEGGGSKVLGAKVY